MAWGTIRETLIRRYCPAVADDITNWSDGTLQAYFTDSHIALKARLCPPFEAAAFDALNSDTSNTDSGNRLIARYAAYLIYIDLPDTAEADDVKRERFIEGMIERLQKGEDKLYDAANNVIEQESLIYHNNTDVQPEFTRTRYDKNTGIALDAQPGTLDQH